MKMPMKDDGIETMASQLHWIGIELENPLDAEARKQLKRRVDLLEAIANRHRIAGK